MARSILFDPNQPLLPGERLDGAPAFDPRLLLRVWIYAYLTGVHSSRTVARSIVESVSFQVLSHTTTPGFWALNRFRTRHRAALGNLLVQTVSLAADLGRVKLASVDEQDEDDDRTLGPDDDGMSLPPGLRDVQAFSEQAAVDADTHVVVAALVTNQPVDAEQLQDVTRQTLRHTGRTSQRFLADAGYDSDGNVQHVKDLGADALSPPEKVRHS